MALSSEESWNLAPREFQALEKMYEGHLSRWGFERALSCSLAGRLHPSGRAFITEDFIQTVDSIAQKAQEERNQAEVRRLQLLDRQNAAMMRAGKFPEEKLPVWARMTPDEKAARGMQ